MTNTIDQEREQIEKDFGIWADMKGLYLSDRSIYFEGWKACAQLQRERQAQPTPRQSVVVQEKTAMQRYNEIMQYGGEIDTPIARLEKALLEASIHLDFLEPSSAICKIVSEALASKPAILAAQPTPSQSDAKFWAFKAEAGL